VDRDKGNFFFVTISSNHYHLPSRQLSKAHWCYCLVFLLPTPHSVDDLLRLLRSNNQEDFGASDGNWGVEAISEERNVSLPLESQIDSD
jgi:hypothetical protein